MFIKYLNKDISHLDRIPQVVSENRGCFYAFIKNINSYISSSTSVVYSMIEQIQPVIGTSFSQDISTAYLERLCTKMGVYKRYWAENTDEATKKRILFSAIQGVVSKRLATSTKQNLSDLLMSLYSGDELPTIEDGADNTGTIMTFQATINNATANVNEAYMSKYLVPQITGVQSNLTFKIAGTLTSMPLSGSGNSYRETETITDNTVSYRWLDLDKKDSNYKEVAVYNTTSSDLEITTTGSWVLEIV